jgi:quercetin dioxygenase-like cupin family protein
MAVRFEDLPVQSGGGRAFRRILEGKTHSGFGIEIHETELASGAMPHPPHHHAHEEAFLIREGTLEVTISNRASRLGPGSVAYVASNEEHGLRNAGATRA